MRYAQLEPPVSAATGRWALANCHLMRDRFTAVDLLAYAGQGGDATVDRVFACAGELGADL